MVLFLNLNCIYTKAISLEFDIGTSMYPLCWKAFNCKILTNVFGVTLIADANKLQDYMETYYYSRRSISWCSLPLILLFNIFQKLKNKKTEEE